ncbi:MAG TPA: hypothetical protein VEI06_12435 [Gemmatimonadaceae bacterium]|nr:hypothetical protein [Gemmatimonadaceae bacterium]
MLRLASLAHPSPTLSPRPLTTLSGAVLLAALVGIAWGCDNPPTSSHPHQIAIAPSHATAIGTDLAIEITSSEPFFSAPSRAVWLQNGVATTLATTGVSSGRVNAVIPGALLSRAGASQIYVVTADPTSDSPHASKVSEYVPFPVYAPRPAGAISLSPAQANNLGNDLTLTIIATSGSFDASSRVLWSMHDTSAWLSTTRKNATELTALVPRDLLDLPDSARVSVVMGDPNASEPLAQTAAASFRVIGSSPGFSISPDSALVGHDDLSLTILGTGFVKGGHYRSWVVWSAPTGDSWLNTTFVDPNHLIALVPASLLSARGIVTVKVLTGDPQSDAPMILSGQANFIIWGSPPDFSVTPDSAATGSPDANLTITGSGFSKGQVHSLAVWIVNHDTTALATTFISAEKLTAVVPAALLLEPLAADVEVLTFDATGAVPPVNVGRATFTVWGASASGSLMVSIRGLPSGASAQPRVKVIGPDGFSQDLASSKSFGHLVPGDYVITATAFSYKGSYCRGFPYSQTVAVSANEASAASVSYDCE